MEITWFEVFIALSTGFGLGVMCGVGIMKGPRCEDSGVWDECLDHHGEETKYVRADLYERLQARVAELEKALQETDSD